MSALCVVDGCPGSQRNKKRGEKIYYFKALEDQLDEWTNAIPGGYKLKLHDRVCSRHFKDDDLIKEWNFVIDDQTVTMPRGRWTLRVGALPAIFDNYDDAVRVKRDRKSKPKSLIDLSSSDEELSEPSAKKKKKKKTKSTCSSKFNSTPEKRQVKTDVNKSPKTNVKTRSHSGEHSGDSSEYDGSWEKACNGLVDQLSLLKRRTPSMKRYAKPAKRGRGRPPKHSRKPIKKDSYFPSNHEQPNHSTPLDQNRHSPVEWTSDAESRNSLIIEEFIASGSDESVGIKVLDDVRSDQMAENQVTLGVTVKEERIDEGLENCDSVLSNHTVCSDIIFSEESNVRQLVTRRKNDRNFAGVVVKREICDCEGKDSQCCEPRASHNVVLEVPTSPLCQEINQSQGSSQITCGEELHIQDLSIDQTLSTSEPRNARLTGTTTVQMCESEILEDLTASEARLPEIFIDPVPFSHAIHETSGETTFKMDLGQNLAGKAGEINLTAKHQPISSVTTAENITNRRRGRPRKADGATVVSKTPSRVGLEQENPDKKSDGLCEMKGSQTQSALTHQPSCNPSRKSLQSGGKELASLETFETVAGKLPKAPNEHLKLDESSDTEVDFLGFSSGEEEEYACKRKLYQNTSAMAAKSTGLYFSKLSRIGDAVVTLNPENSTSHQTIPKACPSSSIDIAINQLNHLGTMLPVGSKKTVDEKSLEKSELIPGKNEQKLLEIPEPMTGDTSIQTYPSTSVSVVEGSAPGFRCDDVLKRGRISDEVTVTKAPIQHLDKVPETNGLDKMTSSSNYTRLNLRTYSRADRISNGSTSSSNCPLKEKEVNQASKHHPIDNVDSSSIHQPKVVCSQNLKDQGTSPIEDEPKNKIPLFSATAARVPLLNSSSLDRIIQSSRSSLLDSGANHGACDPTVEKTSMILKNFKSDGVLALECVVLKEQVRQLQKELFLHKQMLIDSEHNASLLRRRLELQAQLPCVNCVNTKRGFIGKETLI